MKYTKIRDVKNPQGNRKEDAGIDFFIPNDWNDGFTMSIGLGEQELIPLGIKVEVPEGYMLRLDNKSGISKKKGFLVGGGVIDHGYRGELIVSIMKAAYGTEEGEWATLIPGEKIVQGILVKISDEEIEEISNDEYEQLAETSRGEGGFGSTGNK